MPRQNRILKPLQEGQIVESYCLSVARRSTSVYQQRIIYGLIAAAQCKLRGEKFIVGRIIESETGDADIVLTLSNICPNGIVEHSKEIEEAAKELIKIRFEYSLADGTWVGFVPIYAAAIIPNSGAMRISVYRDFWKCLLNFTRGFKRFDFKAAISLNSIYAMRFYEIFSEQENPINYTLAEIRGIFRLEEKYPKPNDFVRWVVNTAKQELDKKAPWSFEYEVIKTGRKITAIRFSPYQTSLGKSSAVKYQLPVVESTLNLSTLPQELVEFLRSRAGFSEKELLNNLPMLREATVVIPDVVRKTRLIYTRGSKLKICKDLKAYVMGSLRNAVKEAETKGAVYRR